MEKVLRQFATLVQPCSSNTTWMLTWGSRVPLTRLLMYCVISQLFCSPTSNPQAVTACRQGTLVFWHHYRVQRKIIVCMVYNKPGFSSVATCCTISNTKCKLWWFVSNVLYKSQCFLFYGHAVCMTCSLLRITKTGLSAQSQRWVDTLLDREEREW